MHGAQQDVDRLVARLSYRADVIAAQMVRVYLEQIPEYRALSPQGLTDVQQISRANIVGWFSAVSQHREVTPQELIQFQDSARRRARAGVSLESLLHAYRLGATVAWQEIIDDSGRTAAELAAALDVAGDLMRYLDFVSTSVTQAYVEEREHLVTSLEAHHRSVLQAIIDTGPDSMDAGDAATKAGIPLAPNYVVLAVTSDAPSRMLRRIAQHLREFPTSFPIIAAPWSGDIVLCLWPAVPTLFDDIVGVQQELTKEIGRVTIALAEPDDGRHGKAVDEALALLALPGGRDSVRRLDEMLLPALIHQFGGRTIGLVRSLVEPLRAEGTELEETLRVYLECNASITHAARRLFLHRNTVGYRLERVKLLTGLDPACPDDLFLLRAALMLNAQHLER